MTDQRLYHYSVIRYVPRPEAEEFVNVGVVAVSDKGDEVSVEFTPNWGRARSLGGREEDILMLRRIATAWESETDSPLFQGLEADEQGGGRSWLNRLYEVSANIVQLSAPHRGLASDIEDIVGDVFDSVIGSAPRPLTRRSAAKRSTAKRATAKRSTAKRSAVKRSTGKRATGKRSTAKNSTAKPSKARGSTSKRSGSRRKSS